MGLQNPATSAKDKYNSLLRVSCEIIGAVKGEQDFQLLITSGNLKGRGGTVKKIGMPQMTQNYRDSSATKVPPKNAFSSAPKTRVTS